MVKRAKIQALADQIVELFPKVEKIILFGSHAYGKPHGDSDVDILVVMRHKGKGFRAATRIDLAIDVDFPLDIIVRSPAELRKRIAMRDDFILQIVSEGIPLYEAGHRRVGEKGGNGFRRRRVAAPVT